MLLSTLPTLPGRNFEVVGLVFATAHLGSLGGGNVQQMVQTIMQQATQLGGNGIIDIKVVGAGDSGHFVMTGTAIRVQ